MIVPCSITRALALFCNDTNISLPLGSLVLSREKGKLAYKSAIAVGPHELDDVQIQNLLMGSLMVVAYYHPGIAAIIEGTATAEEALAMCQKQMPSAGRPLVLGGTGGCKGRTTH